MVVMLRRRMVVVISLVYMVTFVIVMPFLCSDLLYSKYVSKHWTKKLLRAKVMVENSVQYQFASEYLKTLPPKQEKQRSSRGELNITTVVVTVPRTVANRSLGYLTRTVTRLHRLSRSDPYINLNIFVCNVNGGPYRHRELETLRASFHIVDRFPRGTRSRNDSTNIDNFEREKQDYVFCTLQALAGQSEMILIVQDDAVARTSLLPVVHRLLKSERTASRFSANRWSYIQLYLPERWQGFSPKTQTVLELMSIFLLGGTFALRCAASVCRSSYKTGRYLLTLFSIAGVYFVLLALMIGRQHLVGLKHLSASLYGIKPAPGCCIPATLYSASFASKLVEYLSKNVTCSQSFPVDVVIDQFADAVVLSRYLVEPNLFKHIGMMSSLTGLDKYPEQFLV